MLPLTLLIIKYILLERLSDEVGIRGTALNRIGLDRPCLIEVN